VRIAGFGQCRYLVRESEMFVKDETYIACRVGGAKRIIIMTGDFGIIIIIIIFIF